MGNVHLIAPSATIRPVRAPCLFGVCYRSGIGFCRVGPKLRKRAWSTGMTLPGGGFKLRNVLSPAMVSHLAHSSRSSDDLDQPLEGLGQWAGSRVLHSQLSYRTSSLLATHSVCDPYGSQFQYGESGGMIK